MWASLWIFLATLLAQNTLLNAYRVLVYSPRLMESHVNFMAKLADVLIEAGHNVTILDSEIRPELFHRTKYVKDFITVNRSPEIAKITIDYKDMATTAWNSAISPVDQTKAMEKIGELSRLQCEHLANGDVIRQLQNMAPFDVGIHEVFDVCGLGIFEAIGLKKHIIVSSTVMMDAPARYAGIYSGWSTSAILSDYGSEIGLFEKMRNAEFHVGWERFFRMQTDPVEKVFAKKHSMKTPFSDLIGQTSAMFVNTHNLLDSFKPWARFLTDIGGISVNQPQPLNEDYTELISKWNRVVVVSFGTALPSMFMPHHIRDSLLSAFRNFPDTLFVWKYERVDEFSNQQIHNVAFRKFLPQNDLMNSGRVNLFIGHGGQNGLLEAAKAGVPIVVIPIFGDQHRNAKSFEEAGMAILVKKTEFRNDAKIKKAIEEGLNGQKLRSTVSVVSKMLKNPKIPPAQLFTSIVESICEAPLKQSFRPFSKFYDVVFIYKLMKLLFTVFYATIILALLYVSYYFWPNIYRIETIVQFIGEVYRKFLIEYQKSNDSDKDELNGSSTNSSTNGTSAEVVIDKPPTSTS